MADQNTVVSILSTCIIKPSRMPTPARQHMFLPSADFPFRWAPYHRGIMFFKLDPAQQQQPLQHSSFIDHLKSSLAMTLAEFFPFAGRLFEQDDGRLALDCNNAGVPFIEAYVDLPFSSLLPDINRHHHHHEQQQQLQPLFNSLAPHGDTVQWTDPHLPLLSIQVTRFRTENADAAVSAGFVLGFGHSHVVADGTSLWHFMKSWGECARGLPLSMHPVHIRDELRPEKLILPPTLLPPCRCHSNNETAVCTGGSDPAPASPRSLRRPRSAAIRWNMEQLVQRNFYFTAEMVRKLKRMADTHDQGPSDPKSSSRPVLEQAPRPISSLQALAAHIWRHIIMAASNSYCMDSKSENGVCGAGNNNYSCKSALKVVANVRSRLVPPLPEAYFGNAVVSAEAVATEEQLQGETLGDTALRIQEVIQSLDDNFARTLFGKAEVWPLSEVFADVEPGITLKLNVSGSPRAPVYEVDLGWGPPVWVGYPFIANNGGMVWFPGKEGGGSIHVFMALVKPIMDALEQSDSFFSF